MSRMSHWLAPVVLGVAAAGASLMPAPARASDDFIRILVDASDVIFRSGYPYYRHNSGYNYNDRLIVVRDRYGRPVYYRNAPRYGNGHGYGYGHRYDGPQQTRCDSRGRCTTRYYDSRYDRNNRYSHYDNRYYGNRYNGHRYDSRWNDRHRWDRDDD